MRAADAQARFLADIESAAEIVTDGGVLSSYRHDQAAAGLVTAGIPLAMARPRSSRQVQQLVQAAAEHGVPLVPRGAGSGLSGGANAIDGCLIVCLERMDDIIDLDAASLTATVQPGVINSHLRERAGSIGLQYAPDPASYEFSTLGGNIATNAGGLCCVKYGVTRDALLEVEVVLADGRAHRFGRRTRKGVVGYDLASLICGSEGTLGIITEATLRLLPATATPATVVASFESLGAAGVAIQRIVHETTPAVLELMDRTTIAAVEAMAPQGLDENVGALLFGCSDSPHGRALEDVERIGAWCEHSGATLVATTDEAAEGRMLMSARRLAFSALERRGSTLLDDVCVPLAAIPALLMGIESISDRRSLTIGTFGHAGDGNMHPTIIYDCADPSELERARLAFEEIISLALDLGGSVSGEHGIGLLKLAALDRELGHSRKIHQKIRSVLDPGGIMNPGKAI